MQTILAQTLAALAITLTVFAQPASAVVTPTTSPWIRTNSDMTRLALAPDGRFAAFIEGHSGRLLVLDINKRDVYPVSDAQVGGAFFWAPDGFRLFYRELNRASGSDVIKSTLKAYDAALHRSITIDTLTEPTGLLTFDPRDMRMYLMRKSGILTRRINFPGERLGSWQVGQRTDRGRWVATQKGMVWLSQAGLAMRRLEDDKALLESFSISPDGSMAAWATTGERIFVSREGSAPRLLDRGRDPTWHPIKPILLYSGGRTVGKKVISYDLKVADLSIAAGEWATRPNSTASLPTSGTVGRFLTTSQFSAERWPQWDRKGTRIVYTIDRTTDLFTLDFNP